MRSASSVAAHRRLAATVALRGALVCLSTVILLAISGVLPAAAQDRPPGGMLTNPVVRSIDIASPAVVRIATIYNAHITMTACGVTTSLPTSGAYNVGALGSGAFVSAHGDILTADHVVDIDRLSLDSIIFTGTEVSRDVAAFLNAACHPPVAVTANDVANGIVQYNGIPFTTTYSQPQVVVWRSASYLGTIADSAASAPATLLAGLMKAPHIEATVVKSSAFGQNDLALLHVALSDTPSIQLDSSSELAVEDMLTVIGFPGNGDFNGNPTNLLTPSVNNVNISALKSNDNGSQLIQVGGNVEHGDSGGPALDAAGHIVGIVSFGGIEQQGITAFLRSSDNAMEMLNAAHIDTAPGTFQTLWQQAFADYADTASGHWGTAARELDDLSKRYPDFHGLDPYRTYADNAAIHETSSSAGLLALPLPLPIIAAIAGGVVLLLILLIVVAILRGRSRRRARQQQAALVPQPVWAPVGPPQNLHRNGEAPPYPAYPVPPYSQANPLGYGSTYPNYAPPGSAAQGSASSQQRSYAEPARIDSMPSDARDMHPSAHSAPLWDGANSNNGSVLCANGHSVPPGAYLCPVCGAERARSTTTVPRDSRVPWSQNQ